MALDAACSGENIEPQPIEDAVCESRFIKFCTVVGNDCKHLGALLVPDMDALSESHPGVHNLTQTHCSTAGMPCMGCACCVCTMSYVQLTEEGSAPNVTFKRC